MGKGKKKKTRAEEAVDTVVPAPYRPAPEPWATSNDNSRWSLHMTSVPITLDNGTDEGIKSKVGGTLDTTGAPEMHPSLVNRLDRNAMRPRFEGYLRFHAKDDRRLLPFLPLCLAEGLALLQKRDGDLHFILHRCEPLGDYTEAEVGEMFDPPVARRTIADRRLRALALLNGWLAGASCNMPSVQRPTIPRELAQIGAK